MKRIALVGGLLFALAAAPTAAQTRVSLSLGLGVRYPAYVAGTVVGGRPYLYYPRAVPLYPPPRAVVVEVVRPFYVSRRILIVERVKAKRHRHYRHHWSDYDDDDDE